MSNLQPSLNPFTSQSQHNTQLNNHKIHPRVAPTAIHPTLPRAQSSALPGARCQLCTTIVLDCLELLENLVEARLGKGKK